MEFRIISFSILAVSLLAGCQTQQASVANPAGSTYPPAQAPVAQVPAAPVAPAPVLNATNSVTVPAGTRILVETLDHLDSSRQRAGHRFRAKLAGDMVADGKVVAPGGSILYGILAEAKKSRRAVGKAELVLTFTDITINGQLVPIQTSAIQAVTDATTKKSASQVARGAAIGGLADGSSGAKTGAKVGAGAAVLSGGSQVKIPASTLLEFSLVVPLTAFVP